MQIYFKGGCLETALAELKGRHRCFVVTDKPLFDLGYAEQARGHACCALVIPVARLPGRCEGQAARPSRGWLRLCTEYGSRAPPMH